MAHRERVSFSAWPRSEFAFDCGWPTDRYAEHEPSPSDGTRRQLRV